MKSRSNTKRSSRKTILIVTSLFVVTGLAWGGVVLFNGTKNYAQEVAKPLEEALVKAGAVKKCSLGDTGRGSDNDRPNYEGRYQLDMDKNDATSLVSEVAKKSSFTLNHTDSPYESIEWYTDKTSRESSYSELTKGTVELNISTYNDTKLQGLTCPDGTSFVGDETHTAITLSIVMPALK